MEEEKKTAAPSPSPQHGADGAGTFPPRRAFSLLHLAFEIGYLIALPAIALSLCGRFVDTIFKTSPFFLLLGFLLALASSGLLVWKKVRDAIR